MTHEPVARSGALAEAVAAFDAANHAVGRYTQYVVRPTGRPLPPLLSPLRHALQEAAILVVEMESEDTLPTFYAALLQAHEYLTALLRSPADGFTREELAAAAEALREAIDQLESLR